MSSPEQPATLLPREVVADNIKRLRKNRGWSQLELAEAVEQQGLAMSKSTISRFEQGGAAREGGPPGRSREPDLEQLFGVAAAFGVSPVALLMPPSDVDVRVGRALALPSQSYREWLLGRRALRPQDKGRYNDEHVDLLEQTDDWRELQSVAAEAVWLAQEDNVLYGQAMARIEDIRRRLDLVLSRVALKAQEADAYGHAAWQRRRHNRNDLGGDAK